LADATAVLRLHDEQTAAPDGRVTPRAAAASTVPRPAWIEANAPREPSPAVPVAPSRLAPYDFDDEGEPTALPATSSNSSADPEPP
ncbi:hypothetical protein ABTA38_19720, partial [Acinetobacter baumannii]